jgi:Zn-dependent membrane protease YugP
MLLDVDYLLMGLPGILVSAWAWWKSSTVHARASRVPSSSGLTGAEAVLRVLAASGTAPVPIEVAAGPLADHYESGRGLLRLSEPVYFGRSLAAVGIASHEAGHAIQAAARSPWSPLRRVLVPVADLGSILSWLLFLAGISLGIFRLTVWGLAVFSLVVVVQIINLGAEADASRRAKKALREVVAVSPEEEALLTNVLSASAWTHVAAVLRGFPAFLAHGIASGVRVLSEWVQAGQV